jgi:hypothetical protein
MPREPKQRNRILAALSDGEWHSTLECANAAGGGMILAIIRRMNDLKDRGLVEDRWATEGRWKEWRLVAGPKPAQAAATVQRQSTGLKERQPQPPALLPAGKPSAPRISMPPRRPVKQRVCSSGSARSDDEFALIP